MSISAWFYHQLQAMKDRGLNPSFDDVLEGLAKARERGNETPAHLGKIHEQDALDGIEDACRKRMTLVCVCAEPVRRPYTANTCDKCGRLRILTITVPAGDKMAAPALL